MEENTNDGWSVSSSKLEKESFSLLILFIPLNSCKVMLKLICIYMGSCAFLNDPLTHNFLGNLTSWGTIKPQSAHTIKSTIKWYEYWFSLSCYHTLKQKRTHLEKYKHSFGYFGCFLDQFRWLKLVLVSFQMLCALPGRMRTFDKNKYTGYLRNPLLGTHLQVFWQQSNAHLAALTAIQDSFVDCSPAIMCWYQYAFSGSIIRFNQLF